MSKMSYFVSACLGITLLGFSSFSHADWIEQGKGSLTYPSGRTEPLSFRFAFRNENGQNYFYAGNQKVATDEVPPSYTLNLIVSKSGELFVGEFAQGSLHGFDLTIGEQRVWVRKLPEDEQSDSVIGNYRVQIDNRNMLLDTTHPTVVFEFGEDGITGINGSGYKKDLSSQSIN